LFARLAAMWLAFTPYYLELFMGQFSMVQAALLLGILLTAGAAGGHGQRLFGGLWIASVLWKINTAVLAPALARMGRWRTLAAGAALAALTTLPYWLIFPEHAADLWANNFGNTVARPELGNLGFRQLVFAALDAAGAGPEAQAWAQGSVVLAVGGLALALTLWWRETEGGRQSLLRFVSGDRRRRVAQRPFGGYGAQATQGGMGPLAPGATSAQEAPGTSATGLRPGLPREPRPGIGQRVPGQASAQEGLGKGVTPTGGGGTGGRSTGRRGPGICCRCGWRHISWPRRRYGSTTT
jgi:hypothetical protein